MGHISNHKHEYSLLQNRLAQKVQGVPYSPTIIKILSMLFSPEEANLAMLLPHSLTSFEDLSKRIKIPKNELHEKLIELVHRGLVIDIEHNNKSYYALQPVVVGFFEFIFMRARPEMPMAELAKLFEEYFYENNGEFGRSLAEGDTQQFRSLIREETIPDDNYTEVLDWERATYIIESASAISVGICQCLHTAQHLGKACSKAEEVCLTFNYAADSLSRNGIARSIRKNEAMSILANCKEKGLAQTGDNVQRNVSFICNCCGCCCHLMRGIRNFDFRKGVVSSNWIMDIDLQKCKGCGECAKACPIGAVNLEKTKIEGNKNKMWAVRNEELCLGCGVCATVCKTDAAIMKSRPQRVVVPETVFDQRVAMAIERGKLADLIFDDPGKLSHRAMGRMISVLEKSTPFKKAMASETIKSTFLNAVVSGAKKKAGDLAEIFS